MTDLPHALSSGGGLSPDVTATTSLPHSPAPEAGFSSQEPSTPTQPTDVTQTKPPSSPSLLSEPVKQPAPKVDGQPQAQAQTAASPAQEAPGTEIKYEFDTIIPENMKSYRDPEREKAYTDTLRKHKISNEGGQELLQMYIQERNREQQLQATQWNRTQEQMRNEAMADPEYGGARFDATLNSCRSAVNKYGSEQLREVLNNTGAGNHPAVIRFINNMANEIAHLHSSPRPVPATKPAPEQRSRAERRYGNTTPGRK